MTLSFSQLRVGKEDKRGWVSSIRQSKPSQDCGGVRVFDFNTNFSGRVDCKIFAKELHRA